ncbi:uncharacterized protein A1O9_08711 [Exophiala aquamarina CBS 119918]|uniref:Cytochrome P450 oxidoreductase n=1 Tax=Exophiala aquamarina CBS 119918 TaxID=1182545 RepID=A0A072P6Z4_9EURO|nr:uncharacterized protein A1O9_08711 [Exophiala aquamarina CBS 119918]KEF55058.1 hypothetical protein A1O9_08711 [Exophiala aquamarina CBS 119918]
MAAVPFSMLAAGWLGIFIVYKFILQPLLFHPLRHIPSAHWSIPIFGDSWITWQRYKERNNAVTYAAHLKHGTVVRMGANELSVNCVENGIRTIYAGGWEKHAWYPQRFASYGVINMFSTIHHLPHSQKKRTIAHVYSKSYIASSPQVAANSVALLSTRFLPLLDHFATTSQAVDVHDLNNAMAMDFMSAFQFGLRSSTNFTQDVAKRNEIMHLYHCRREFEFFSAEMPWIKSLTKKLGFPVVPRFVDEANDLLEKWNAEMCDEADGYAAVRDGLAAPFAGDEPLVYSQFKSGMLKLREKDGSAGKELSSERLILPTTRHAEPHDSAAAREDTTQAEIYSDMLDQLGAGHETSAIALTYLYWELSKRPQLTAALRTELLTLTPPIHWPLPPGTGLKDFRLPEPKQLDALSLLNAIVMETLRVHTPIPGIEPRISPHTAGGNTLGAYANIPGGVRVSSMPYTLHRNRDVFPDPDAFNPHRWLPSHTDEEQLKEMHRWFWAFGSGGRMCIGSHLATHEIKLLVAAIYSNWTTEIVDDDGIEEIDAYTTRPRANRCMLRFVRV